jgi:dTDP-4-amino-4,6-dideoxygalactose transaminase
LKAIYVTKPFLPPIKKYQKYLDIIWKTSHLTNDGPLVKKLEKKLRKYLNVVNFHFVTNGTIALQLALNALDITDGEIITSPFSAVATVSSILWERCRPVFVDIEPDTFCIDPKHIEKAVTENTKAILAVHVYGIPCIVKEIESIANKHKLKVIYDGAHAFGTLYNGKSLLSYGDISTCSFHATKIFHTGEGGCLIVKDKKASDKIELIKRFGYDDDEHYYLGINARASEFQAAMGLCNFEYIDEIIKANKIIVELYDELLKDVVQRPRLSKEIKYNYSYYPAVFSSEEETLNVIEALKRENIYPRRYFYPSLNTLPYLLKYQKCPISEDISRRIFCLPLYVGLEKNIIKKICNIVKRTCDKI